MNTKLNEEKNGLLEKIGDDSRPLLAQLRDALALARMKNLGRPTRSALRAQLKRIEAQTATAENQAVLAERIAEIKVVLSRNRRLRRDRLDKEREEKVMAQVGAVPQVQNSPEVVTSLTPANADMSLDWNDLNEAHERVLGKP